jgi:hypothetical protein
MTLCPGAVPINVDHIQMVAKKKIGALITILSPEKLKQVRKEIIFARNLRVDNKRSF